MGSSLTIIRIGGNGNEVYMLILMESHSDWKLLKSQYVSSCFLVDCANCTPSSMTLGLGVVPISPAGCPSCVISRYLMLCHDRSTVCQHLNIGMPMSRRS